MQRSNRVVIPVPEESRCPGTNNGNHIVEYKVSDKTVWCVQCGLLMNWDMCLPYILDNALRYMESLQEYE